MEIKFNIENYLSEEEMKEIAIEEFKSMVRDGIFNIPSSKRMDNYERIIGNSVHHYLESKVDKLLNCNTKDLISKYVEKVFLKPDYQYHIFRQKSAWDTEDSIGTKYLKEAVTENKSLIQEKVKKEIEAINFYDLKEDIKGYILEVIDEKLKA